MTQPRNVAAGGVWRRHGGSGHCVRLGTVLLLALAGWSIDAEAQIRPRHAWAPSNFDTTANGNVRGARLTSRAQLDSMKRIYGVTTVINLAKDALPKSGPSEIEWCADLGIRYIPVYLGSKPPSAAAWQRIVAALDSGGVYVHCAHGADRTGAVLARYRIERGEVNQDAAYREARRYGFKPWLKDLRAWIDAPRTMQVR